MALSLVFMTVELWVARDILDAASQDNGRFVPSLHSARPLCRREHRHAALRLVQRAHSRARRLPLPHVQF
jgi:hypothetical protein